MAMTLEARAGGGGDGSSAGVHVRNAARGQGANAGAMLSSCRRDKARGRGAPESRLAEERVGAVGQRAWVHRHGQGGVDAL